MRVIFILLSVLTINCQHHTFLKEQKNENQLPEKVPEDSGYIKNKETWVKNKIDTINLTSAGNNYVHLKKLEWLIGEWEAQSKHGTVHSKYSWGANKNYMIFEFSISRPGVNVQEGIELIRWDKDQKAICSWCLNSSGGEAPEECWTLKDNRWFLKVKDFKSDVGSFVVYTPINTDSYTWELREYKNGTVTEKIAPITHTRK